MNSVLDDTRDICVIQPRELNSIICKFLINVRTKSGTEYEPTSVKGMISSFDRYLRANNYGTSIKKGDIFDQARRVLTAKTMDLKKMGKGNKPNKAQAVTDEEVDRLFNTGQMGMEHPDALLRMMWFQNTVHFGMRTVTEHVNMKWGDIKLCTSKSGTQFLQYSERATKTRTGANPGNVRDVPPRSWKNLEDPSRCHVLAYIKYKELRPNIVQSLILFMYRLIPVSVPNPANGLNPNQWVLIKSVAL